MNTISAYASGVQTLQNASASLNGHAGNIARASADLPVEAPLTDSLIGLQQAETYALSGVKVIQAADNVLGTLLDIEI
ncbi:hypothetical protein [Marinobacterium aestuariivivens]|uniref:Flagellar basal-body/hook protein C-terminal domain-containing protein n=1 Tax=Marinobacterium aestuariivivens TaxID=1698799 RepID=A0ABW2A0R8_9GAMM